MNIFLRRFVPTLVAGFAPICHSATGALVHQLDSAATVTLHKRSIVKIPHPLGRRIVCESGAIWITVDYDRKDFVLEAGDSFSATQDRQVVIQALEPAAISVA
jgi:hypothetical protein